MRVEDEYGTPWSVQPRDPARNLILTLKRMNFTWVVLPRYTLMRGTTPEPPPPPPLDVSIASTSGVVSRFRLLDCLEALSGAS